MTVQFLPTPFFCFGRFLIYYFIEPSRKKNIYMDKVDGCISLQPIAFVVFCVVVINISTNRIRDRELPSERNNNA